VVNGLLDAGAVPCAGIVQRPVAKQLHLDFTAAGAGHGVAFSTVASGAAQMMVIQFAPAPNACSASVSPASATFQSATMISPDTGRAGPHCVKPLGQAEDGARFHDINVIL
jgi:hypothetical protein